MALIDTLDFFLEEVFRLPIRKALDPNDPHDFAKIADALAKATAGLAQAEEAKALKKALAALDVDWKKMDGATKLKVVNAAKAAVNPAKAVLPKLEEHFEANALKIGMATKGAATKTFGFTIAPNLTAVQVKTLHAVALSQGNYVRDEYGKRSDIFGLKAKQIVTEELAKGTTQKEIAARLAKDLAAQQFKRSDAYWNVVANSFANRARTYTNLSSYQEAGITHFEFESVIDERTSHVCRLMHRRKFPVAQALGAFAASEKAGGDVRTHMPWVSEGAKDVDGNLTLRAGGVLVATVTSSGMGKVDEKGTFSGVTSTGLASMGIMTPPLHGNCRSSIVPIMGAKTVTTASGPMPAEFAPPPPAPPFALTSPGPVAPAAPSIAPLAPDHTDQEALFFEGAGHGNKPLDIHYEQQGFAFGPGGILGKPISVPALDPTQPPVVAVIPFKDKAVVAQGKLDALKLIDPSTFASNGSVPNPVKVKKSPLLGGNDPATEDIINAAYLAKSKGEPLSDYGMKHMPKKLESLQSTRDYVDAAKVELYLKNPKLINEAMNDGRIVAVKIGKDIFIVQGHEYVAAAQLMDRAELKIVEINLKSAAAKAKEKAELLREVFAKEKAAADLASAAAAKWQAEQDAKDAAFFAEQAAKKAAAAEAAAARAAANAEKLAAANAAADAANKAKTAADKAAAEAKNLVAPPKPGAPIDPAFIMHTKTDRPGGGSNNGAFYKDGSGVERFVKLYGDPAQAHGEHLANAIYRALGQGGPESVTWKDEQTGKNAYAAKLIDGKQLGLSPGKEQARKFFDGFAADCLLGNWDAAGMSGDNAFVTKDGKIIRLDNGGAFLMRAQGGKKTAKQMEGLPELETYFPDNALGIRNPGYHALAREAGYTSVADFKDSFRKQVADITALKNKHGGWNAFIDAHSPGMPDGPDRQAMTRMLEEKHDLLMKKAEELGRPPPPPGARPSTGYRGESIQNGTKPRADLKLADLKETEPPKEPAYGKTPWGEDAHKFNERTEKELMKIPAADRAGITHFTNGTYRSCRASEAQGPDGPLNSDAKAIKRAFEKGRPEPGTAYRGIQVPKEVAEKMMRVGGVTRLGENNTPASTSTSWNWEIAKDWAGGMSDSNDKETVKVKYIIHHRSGMPIRPISEVPREDEVMIPAAAEFRILGVSRLKGTSNVIFIEMEEIGEDAPPEKKKRTRKPKATT